LERPGSFDAAKQRSSAVLAAGDPCERPASRGHRIRVALGGLARVADALDRSRRTATGRVGVDQLVCEQLGAGPGVRSVAPCPEHDMPADGVGLGPNGRRRASRSLVAVNPHAAEVRAEA
jgi:hypothetical protein